MISTLEVGGQPSRSLQVRRTSIDLRDRPGVYRKPANSSLKPIIRQLSWIEFKICQRPGPTQQRDHDLFFFTPGRRWVGKPLPHSFEPRFESRRPDAAKWRLALGVGTESRQDPTESRAVDQGTTTATTTLLCMRGNLVPPAAARCFSHFALTSHQDLTVRK